VGGWVGGGGVIVVRFCLWKALLRLRFSRSPRRDLGARREARPRRYPHVLVGGCSINSVMCCVLLPHVARAVDAATYTAGSMSAVGALFIICCVWAYDRQAKLFTKLVLVLACIDFLVSSSSVGTRACVMEGGGVRGCAVVAPGVFACELTFHSFTHCRHGAC
jgi:hypothetical protein